MCTVSMVLDWQQQKVNDNFSIDWTKPLFNQITREEFEALRKDFEDFKKLLKRAKVYDEENDEPDCETEEKVALVKRVAEELGVEIEIL